MPKVRGDLIPAAILPDSNGDGACGLDDPNNDYWTSGNLSTVDVPVKNQNRVPD